MTNIQAFYFSGNPSKRAQNTDRLRDLNQRDVFLENLKQQKVKIEQQKKNEEFITKLQCELRRLLAKRRFLANLRLLFDEQIKIAPIEKQADRIRRFYAEEDVDRMSKLCHELVPFLSKLSSDQLDNALWTRFCTVLLQHLENSAGSKNRNFNAELRLLEILIEKSRSCLQALVVGGYFTCLESIYEQRISAPIGNRWRVELRLPGKHAEEIYSMFIRPMHLVTKEDSKYNIIRLIVYNHFVETMINRETFSPFFICHILPQINSDIEKGLISAKQLLDSFMHIDRQIEVYSAGSCVAIQMIGQLASDFHRDNAETIIEVLSAFAPKLVIWLDEAEGARSVTSTLSFDSDLADDEETMPLLMEIDDYHSLNVMVPTTSEANVATHQFTQLPNTRKSLLQSTINQLQRPWLAKTASIALSSVNDVRAAKIACPLAYTLLIIAQHRYYGQYSKFPSVFTTLCAQPLFLKQLWAALLKHEARPLICLENGQLLDQQIGDDIIPQLTLFCVLLKTLLHVVDDDEFYQTKEAKAANSTMCFTNGELASISRHIRDCALGLVDISCPEVSKFARSNDKDWTRRPGHRRLLESVASLQLALHDVDIRVHFCQDGFWQAHGRRVIRERIGAEIQPVFKDVFFCQKTAHF